MLSSPNTQTPQHGSAPFSATASTYASNVGRTSALSATRLIQLAHTTKPLTPSSTVLDNGAGTGAATFAVAAQFPDTHVTATDISASMLDHIASQLRNVTTQVVDALKLTSHFTDRPFTHVFNTFVLQTITTPLDALREMHAVLAPGGVAGIALWARRNGPVDIWEEACLTLDPEYKNPPPFDDPNAWRTIGELEAAMEEVGFEDVRVEEARQPFEFESAEAFAKFWMETENPVPVKCRKGWSGDVEEARRAVVRVVRERHEDGKGIDTWAILGVGRK